LINKQYDYVIIGAGIAGSSVAYWLDKYNDNFLLIDKNSTIANEASGAAGAFLSPLLGKPNPFKDLVNKALVYSVDFYKQNFPELIDNCGTTRIPKNLIDQEKFQSYKPYIDFKYHQQEGGYYFPIASIVKSKQLCEAMTKNINKLLDYEVNNIYYKDNLWHINNQIKTKNIILTTGYLTNLIDEFYLKIRAVWGRRIDIQTPTITTHNYHKACSVSKSYIKDNQNIISIGATHHRDYQSYCNKQDNFNELLQKANDIIPIQDPKIIANYGGARACSVDYFPLVGKIINSSQTLKEFPHIANGTYVNPNRFTTYPNLYILNGVGGRGFVLSIYLANLLIKSIYENISLDKKIESYRLFVKEARKIKQKGKI